jgi:hypothetical protein
MSCVRHILQNGPTVIPESPQDGSAAMQQLITVIAVAAIPLSGYVSTCSRDTASILVRLHQADSANGLPAKNTWAKSLKRRQSQDSFDIHHTTSRLR